MKNPHDYWTIEAMQKYGGSFVQALAKAAMVADSQNIQKIKLTWPEYWRQYYDWGQKMKAEDEKEKDEAARAEAENR